MRNKTILALVLACLTMGAYFPFCARLFTPAQTKLAATGDAKFDRGREVFVELGCNACHTREGIGGASGPDLDQIAGPENRERIFLGILKPPLEPSAEYGVVMPRGLIDHLSDEDAEALLHYLTRVTPSVE